MLEMALLSPWIIFLFVGAFDMGFYAYSLITIETAARSAAWNEGTFATQDSTRACGVALAEMSTLVNMSGVTCSTAGSPLVVTASQTTGPDGTPAAQVSLTYTTPSMIPIPGLLAKQFTITRVVTMKIDPSS